MSGAICGGQHSRITTKKQMEEHIAWEAENPYVCMDCCCGIGFPNVKEDE